MPSILTLRYFNTTLPWFFVCRSYNLDTWILDGKTTKLMPLKRLPSFLGGGNSKIFGIFTPKMRKSSKLTYIFQMGWNHQPVLLVVQVIFFTFIKPSCLLWQPKMGFITSFGEKIKMYFYQPPKRTSKSKQISMVSTNKMQCSGWLIVINHSHEVWWIYAPCNLPYPPR